MSNAGPPEWFTQFMAFFALTAVAWVARSVFYYLGLPGYGHGMIYFLALMVAAMFATPVYYEEIRA